MKDSLRLFVAFDPPDSLKQSLKEQLSLMPGEAGLRWVAPQMAHVTLKFIGYVDKKLLPRLETQIEEAARKNRSMHLDLKGSGAFPSPARARVLWLSFSGDIEEAQRLAKEIDMGVAKLGVPREKRRYVPHLTLARARQPVNVERLMRVWDEWVSEKGHGIFEVREIVLYKSELKPAGSEYSRISEFPLGERR